MDTSKLLAVAAFCLVSLIVSFFIPLFSKAWISAKSDPKKALFLDIEHWYFNVPASVILSVALYFRLGAVFLIGVFGLVLLTVLLKNPKPLANAALVLLAALITSYLPWWRITEYHLSLSTLETLSVLGVTAVMVLGLTWPVAKTASKPISNKVNVLARGAQDALALKQWLLLALFVAAAAIFVLYKGPILDRAMITTWHHWGAFIGPAQLVVEGVLPLHDVPVQYGFGPTVLSALSCGVLDCWTGFYWVNVGFVICFFAALAYAALCFSRQASIPAQVAILTSVAICTLGWTMYPPSLISPLSTPSTSGMRFLPGTLMMTFLVHVSLGSRKKPAILNTKIIGHLLWMFGLLWSPEAAIHTTFLWGPFFVWSSVFYGPHAPSMRQFFIQVAILVGVFFATLIGFVLVYTLYFGEMPLWSMYTAALRNPPGVMAIDYKASIWVALACFSLWFAALWGSHRRGTTDRSTLAFWVTMLFALVTFTYFLGRSHSNNVLNLLPYFAIMLVAIRSSQTAWAAQQLANMLLAGFVGWSVLFGLNYYKQAQDTAGYFAHQSTSIPMAMTYQDSTNVIKFAELDGVVSDTLASQQNELRKALSYIGEVRDEPAEIFDVNMLIDANSKYGPWSGIHPIATTYFSTSEQRRHYLRNVMKRLNRSGWIVVSDTFPLPSVVEDYDAVYERTEEMAFGTYTAIRYSPKLDLGTQ